MPLAETNEPVNLPLTFPEPFQSTQLLAAASGHGVLSSPHGEVSLPPTEYTVLKPLVEKPYRVIPQKALLRKLAQLTGDHYENSADYLIRVYLSRARSILRQHLLPEGLDPERQVVYARPEFGYILLQPTADYFERMFDIKKGAKRDLKVRPPIISLRNSGYVKDTNTGEVITLTPLESKLLDLVIEKPGNTVENERLLKVLKLHTVQAIRVNVGRTRAKLGSNGPIFENIPGIGYKWAA